MLRVCKPMLTRRVDLCLSQSRDSIHRSMRSRYILSVTLLLGRTVDGRAPFLPSMSSTAARCFNVLAAETRDGLLPNQKQQLTPQRNILHKFRGGGGRSDEILRIRLPDGSLQRLQLTEEIRSMTVSDVLQKLGMKSSAYKQLQLDGTTISRKGLVSDLPDLRHGSLLSIVVPQTTTKKTPKTAPPFIPFADLHKKWNDRRYLQRHRPTSYAALADFREATLHRVDEVSNPQRIHRLDICESIARSFVQKTELNSVLLLGEITKRFDTKSRHSLDGHAPTKQTTVAKVHAMVNHDEKQDAMKVAQYLGLRVIGWMVHSSVSHETALVPSSSQILQAAKLQIQSMQDGNAEPFSGFCTVVCDRQSGATEVYQLTDVAVQMASEELLSADTDEQFHTCHPILIEGQETTELEAILTLVNTAVASHQGLYSRSTGSSVKSTGRRITKRVRSKLSESLQQDNDNSYLNILADFGLLMALVGLLNDDEGRELCETVRAFAKGRTKTTALDATLRKRLQEVLMID